MILRLKIPQKACRVLYSKNKRYKVLRGGRGSAKSWSVGRYLIQQAFFRKIRILCTREIQSSIRDSVHKLLSDQIDALGLTNYFTITRDSIISHTGAEFIFKGLRHNIAEVKSTEGVDICWVEEAEVVGEESWAVLIPTIRKEGSEIIITFNPEDEKSSTYTRFVAREGVPVDMPDMVSDEVNYPDNPWFSDTLRAEMEYDKRVDTEKYEHIWLGKPKKYGNACIFKGKIEVIDFETPEGVQLFFGADFGFSNDPTCLIRMWMKERRLYIDHEAYAVGVEIEDLPAFFSSVPAVKRWRIVADSARPETISFLRSKGFCIDGASKGKGSVEDGIEFLRSFEKIIIHPRCKGSIGDFQNYKWKVDRITNDILPIPTDASNHSVDACLSPETLIRTDHGDVRIDNIKTGDMVLTRSGFRKVRRCWVSRKNAEVLKITTANGRELICTPDHKIIIPSGQVRADALRYGVEVLTVGGSPCRGLISKNTQGRFIEDTRNQKKQQKESISGAEAHSCIGRFGLMQTGTSQEVCTSITKTETPQTTRSTTLSAPRQRNTQESTQQKKQGKDHGTTSTRSGILLQSGTDQKKGSISIEETENLHGSAGEKNQELASNVQKNFNHGLDNIKGFAQTVASLHTAERSGLITSLQIASFVGMLLHETNMQGLELVASGAERSSIIGIEKEVWDIEVEDEHEFFANGILVHNCRYALENYIKSNKPMITLL